MARKYEQAAETGRREAQAALDWIAQRVKRADEGTPVVVFNGLSWPRTGPVEVVVPEELRAEVRVLDAAGRSLSCQMLAGRRLVFVCEEVPATGYRTVFLTPGPAGESAAKPAPGEKWTEPFETEHYRATPCPGGLRSLLDKETGKEVFRTDRWRGGEWVTFCTKAMGACEGIDFAPHPEVFQDRAGNHQPDWVCVESGPVLVRWATAPIKSQHCAVKVSFTMYRRLKRVDWRVEVAGNSNEINVEQRLLFPINAPKPELAYQVPFGVVKPGTSEPFVFVNKGHFKMPAPIPAHPREVQDWVYATGDGLGITLSTSIGACAFTDFGPGANANQVVVAPILLASIGNPQRKAYLQPGDYEFFFSLSTHQAGFAHGARRGLEAQNPLWPVRPAQRAADAALPPACSFFAVQPSRAALSTIKKAEDEDALVLRLYDLEGVAGDAQVQSCFKIEAAEATDLLERGGKALPAQAQAFTVSLKAWSVETIKARARK
jgi:alpha-mannosidase